MTSGNDNANSVGTPSGTVESPSGDRHAPGAITLENARVKMMEASLRMREGRELVMDMSDSAGCDSAALGAMIEWRRAASERGCRLRYVNVGGRLEKLIHLYQVEDLFPSANLPHGWRE